MKLSWISNKTIIEVGNITKAAICKSFLHLSYKHTQLLFLWTMLFNSFMRQTLTYNFGGLHKNMNKAFPSVMFECIFRFDIDRKFNLFSYKEGSMLTIKYIFSFFWSLNCASLVCKLYNSIRTILDF